MAYSKNLSSIHDQGFGDVAVNAARFMVAHMKKFKDKPLIVDLGCGSGVTAQEFVQKGFRVYGIDISKEMIRIAKKKVPAAEFKCASYLDVKIPNCKAITSIGEVFNYLFDKKIDVKILSNFFRGCFQALEKGGLLVFDIMEFSKKIDHNRKGFKITPTWVVTSESIEDTKTHILSRNISSFVKHGKNYTRTDEVHKVLLYDRNDILKALKKVGFEVQVQPGYGKLLLRPGCSVYICKKA